MFIRSIRTILAIFAMSIYSANAQNYDEPVKLGPIKVNLAWCEDLGNLSSFLSAFQSLNFPIGGVGAGFGSLLISENSVVLEYCSFLARLKSLNLEDASLLALDFANRQTGNKMDDEYELFKTTLDIKDVFFDENGKRRGSVKMSVINGASRINRAIQQGAKYSDENFGTTFDLRSRAQKEAEMARMSQIALKRAKIQDILTCPAPKFLDPELDDIYEKQVAPMEEQIEIYETKVDFLYESLLKMGQKFVTFDDDKNYKKDIYDLMTKSYRYIPQTLTAKVKSEKQVKKNLPVDAPVTADKTEFVETTINKAYQVFCENKKDPNNLKEDCRFSQNLNYQKKVIAQYSPRWQGYVNSQLIGGGSFGLFEGDARIERSFRDNTMICNRGEYMEKYDRASEDFFENVEQDYQKCIKETDMKISKTGSLYTFYVNELLENQKKLMKARASIWTFESYHLGYFRTLSDQSATDNSGAFEQQTVQCAPIENLALLQQKTAEMLATNAEINQVLVEQSFKQYNLLEEEKKRKEREAEEIRRSNEIEKELKRRRDLPYKDYVSFPEINKGM